MFESAALSDAGRKRQSNEDYYLINEEAGLCMLADGMGGHSAGEIASRMAITAIDEFVALANEPHEMTWPFGFNVHIPYEHSVLKTAVLVANLRVTQSAEQAIQYSGMGCTLVLCWIRGETAFFTSVGDSRLYLFRKGELRQLTEDDTLVQEQIKQGVITAEEAKVHRLRHVVTKAVGARGRLEVEVDELPLEANDLLLMLSDGVTDKLSDTELCRLLVSTPDLSQCCRALIDAANAAGGEDNSTAVLLRYRA
jgi:PPM family protein phosphatase